jgi:hypothetical protein
MELDARSSGGHPTLYMTLEAPLDETSGDEANKDDIAVIMIRALAHMRNERVPINSASPGECCHWSSRPAA